MLPFYCNDWTILWNGGLNTLANWFQAAFNKMIYVNVPTRDGHGINGSDVECYSNAGTYWI